MSGSRDTADRRRMAIALVLWIGFAAAVVIAVLTGKERTVLHAYRLGASRWLAGDPLYDDTGHGFLYFPQAAVLFVPWTALPLWWGETAWRVFNIATLAGGIHIFSRAASFLSPRPRRGGEGTSISSEFQLSRLFSEKPPPSDVSQLFLLTSIVSILLAWPSARTGQMTIVMTALMLVALADLMGENWTRAACALWLAFALKPIILPLLLLVPALWPRHMLPRMLAGGVLTAAMPFLFQRPQYVLDQYQLLPVMLRSAHDLGHREFFTQAFGMIAAFGCHVPDGVQSLARGLGAIATLIAGAVMKRRLAPIAFVPFLGALTASYILLFNPRTESNTYALLGPFLGYYLATSWLKGKKGDVATLTAIAVLIIGTFELGKHFLAGHGTHVLAPAATIAFLVWLWRAANPPATATGIKPA